MIPEAPTPSGTAPPELLDLELADVAPGSARAASSATAPFAEPAAAAVAAATAGPDAVMSGAPDAVMSGTLPREVATPTERIPAKPVEAPAPSAERAPFAERTPFSERAQADSLPGSSGEHLLQAAYGTQKRAKRFYDDQVLDHLNARMREFIGRMDMAFVATADGRGECDASFRAGPPGFIEVLDEQHVAYPEYRGNGVHASLGNISENPRVGILLVDFVTDLIGLHVNGRARIVEDADLRAIHPELPADFDRARTPERWVVVQVVECYIHCRKHIPRMAPVLRQRSWGTDDVKRKGGDFFEAKATARSDGRASAPVASGPV